MPRTSLLRTALGAAAALVASAAGLPISAQAANSGDRPNVVVIQTDDQTQESIRVMSETNRLIARKGTTFTNSLVSFSLCCPSRATLLTGQYAHNHGVLDNELPLGGYQKLDGTSTLAVWLQREGYYTALLGKYLNDYGSGNGPNNDPTTIPPGWSEWRGSVDPSTYRYFGYTLNERGTLRTYGLDGDPAAYQTDVYAAKASELIRRRARSSKPFFLWTAFTAPHAGPPEPDDPPEIDTPVPAPRDKDRFANQPLPADPAFNEADASDKPYYIGGLRPVIGPTRVARIRENYRQQLETLLSVDRAVATIVGALEDSGELADTLVIYTSDNGFLNGEHRIAANKLWPYEPSVRVPLLMRGPDVPRGKRRTQLVANIDLAPTILDAAGATAGRRMDGRSLLPLATSPELELGRDILLENGPFRQGARPEVLDPVGITPRYVGLRTRRYLYVEYDTGEKELYDLANDPSQLTNQVNNPAWATIRGRLAARLARARACRGTGCLSRPSLSTRLSYSRGSDDGRTCATGNVTLSLRGDDRGLVTRLDLYVDGKRIKDSEPEDTAVVATRSRLKRGALVTLRARALTSDDRAITLSTRVRACS